MRPLSLLWILALLPGWASAHPADEVVLAAYLTLAPVEVRLKLDLNHGAEVAGKVLSSLDVDYDEQVTEGEARTFALEVLQQSNLTLDDEAAPWTLAAVSVPPLGFLRTGNAVLKIVAVALRSDDAGERELIYEARYRPAKSLWMANVFLQAGKGWEYQITGQKRSDDGGRLAVNYAASRP